MLTALWQLCCGFISFSPNVYDFIDLAKFLYVLT